MTIWNKGEVEAGITNFGCKGRSFFCEQQSKTQEQWIISPRSFAAWYLIPARYSFAFSQACIYLCMQVCVGAWYFTTARYSLYIIMHAYKHASVCLCLCVCIGKREREREREKETFTLSCNTMCNWIIQIHWEGSSILNHQFMQGIKRMGWRCINKVYMCQGSFSSMASKNIKTWYLFWHVQMVSSFKVLKKELKHIPRLQKKEGKIKHK